MSPGLGACRRRALTVLTLAVVLLAGCSSTHSGGDPGNRRLNEIATVRVFALLPPGSTRTAFERTPAKYETPAFQGHGWDGPFVKPTFTSPAPILDVYAFYDRAARAEGGNHTRSATYTSPIGGRRDFQTARWPISI